ncbi:hypothetical protein AAVH_16282 [Aphelenchoides avenae]|nr:hypothetical protein AAVH_16282 [Aphelenchus avenae]
MTDGRIIYDMKWFRGHPIEQYRDMRTSQATSTNGYGPYSGTGPISTKKYDKFKDFNVQRGEPVWHGQHPPGQDGADGRRVFCENARCKILITKDNELKVPCNVQWYTRNHTVAA